MLLSITVNTFVDENNGIGVGGISLREAVAAAAPGDTIDFVIPDISHGPVTSLITNGPIVIDKPLTIFGPGEDALTLDGSQNTGGDGNGGIFQIIDNSGTGGNNVSIYSLRLTGGHALYFGGAIYNLEKLSISGCTLDTNSSSFGGAIYSSGDLTLSDCRILNNIASLGGGGINSVGTMAVTDSLISGNSSFGGAGGGVMAYGNTTVSATTIASNSANTTGGGIQFGHGVLSITNSTLSGNAAVNSGGAAYIKDLDSPDGTNVTIGSSAIVYNSAGSAGGIFASAASLALSQVTLAQNHATVGGGIELFQDSSMTIRYSTIAENSATQFGGGVALVGGALTLDNSIIAKNTGSFGPDIAKLFSSTLIPTYSLIGDNSDSGLTANQGVPDASGNLIGGGASHQPLDPVLSDLTKHAGTTVNYVPLPGSPAIDHGNPAAVAGVGTVPQFDQRNSPYVRVAGGRLDMGAIESQILSPLNLVVDTLVDEDDGNYSAGDLSLREAIRLANERVFSSDTISFAPALTASGPASIVLTHSWLTISDSVVINGPSGANKLTIDASGNDLTPGIKDNQGSNIIQTATEDTLLNFALTLNNLTLTGGDYGGEGGAIENQASLTLNSCVLINNHAAGNGGTIESDFGGSLVVNSSTISGNTSDTSGGALYVIGNTAISNSAISGNSAKFYGGAIYATKSDEQSTQLTITAATIENNSANIGGGVDANASLSLSPTTLTLNISQSTISGNSAHAPGFGTGGGVYVQRTTLQIDNSTISGNTSTSTGGGITSYNSGVTIRNSTITKNSAQASVSGIRTKTSASSQIQIKSSIVAGNIGANSDIDSGSVGSFISLGYNLVGPGTTSPFNAPGDQVTSDPKLGPLANNGGPTKTHALLAGSLAIDMGDPAAVAGVGGVPATDQRGAPYARVFDGDSSGGARIDIGAFELQTVANASSGDYSHNGRVDASDYVLWRNAKGATGVPAFTGADGDGDGTIGTGDYNVWRSHFGNTTAGSGVGGGVSAAVVDSAASATTNWLADYSVAVPTSSPSTTRSALMKSVDANELGKSSHTKTQIAEYAIDSNDQVREDALVAWLATGGREAPRHSAKEFDRLATDSNALEDAAGIACESLFSDVLDRFDILS